MPKIVCKCGEILNYSYIPCEIEYKFISDVDYDKYSGMIDSEDLYSNMKSMLLCNKCFRLWVFWLGYKEKPTEYSRSG
jgi:hypothetical protein